MSNRNVPAIPTPTDDPRSVPVVLQRLREGVESLSGQRGGPLDRAVTLNDLVRLGLVTEAEAKTVA